MEEPNQPGDNLEDSSREEKPDFDWEEYRPEIEKTLELAGYEVAAPPPNEPSIVRAKRDWGLILASIYINYDGRLHFTLTRPVDQVWAKPIRTGEYTFEVSRSTSESLTVLRDLTSNDCQKFRHLLEELENIGHANWKQLGLAS